MDVINLKDQVAIITGGAQGIGFASAEFLCKSGAICVIADIDEKKAFQSANRLEADGCRVAAMKVDVSCQESVANMMNCTFQKYQRIDILVNNAGILDSTPIPELTEKSWDRLLEIDLKGVHLCSQSVIPFMKKNHYGKIINLSSQAGQLGGWKAGVNYSAAKGGVLALTKAYARYAAQFNITVNAISPGFIATEMTTARRDKTDGILLERLGTPEDVAKVVLFLASDLSSYITGFTVDVNGGFYLH